MCQKFPGDLLTCYTCFDFLPQDINECSRNAHLCESTGRGGECRNTDGSYRCLCREGYTGNGIQVNNTLGNETGTACTGMAISVTG